jgi:periplasmic divalent cation tolerance protein
MSTSFRIVLCSCPNLATAKALADKLLRARLVGCVNIGAQSTSMYWWEDHIHSEEEVMLTMKTTAAQIGSLFDAIQQAHPYEVPEIIAVPISEGSDSYLSWLTKVTQ